MKKLDKLAIVLLLIAIISLILIIVKIGFSLWFWIFLVVWIVIFILYLLTELFLKYIWVFWILFLVWFILPLILVFTGAISSSSGGKTTSSGSKSSLVACTSTVAEQPATISGYKSTMFAQPVEYSGDADDGTRTFSIKELDAKTGKDIFFRFEKNDAGNISGVKGLIEVCDSNNMTKKYSSAADSTTTGASDNATAITYYMHGNKKVTTPGVYRVDAYANVDGSWKLVGRVSNITVNE